MSDGTFSLTGGSRHPTLPSGLPQWLSRKESTSNADVGSIPGWRRCPGGRTGNPLEHSCPGNPVSRGAWWATVHGVAKESDVTWRLNNNDNCFHRFFPQSWVGFFLTCVHRSVPSWVLVGAPLKILRVFLCVFLLSKLWPANPIRFGLPGLHLHFFNPGSLLGSAWDNAQGHLISVLSLRDSFLSFPNVQCFESFYSIYSIQFSDRKFFIFLLIHLSQK